MATVGSTANTGEGVRSLETAIVTLEKFFDFGLHVDIVAHFLAESFARIALSQVTGLWKTCERMGQVELRTLFRVLS